MKNSLGYWFPIHLPRSGSTIREKGIEYLIDRPVFLARTPNLGEGIRMDVLSEVLRVVRLEGALFFNAEFTAPWCVSSSRSTALPVLGPNISPGAGHLILYHLLTEGRAYAKLP